MQLTAPAPEISHFVEISNNRNDVFFGNKAGNCRVLRDKFIARYPALCKKSPVPD